MMNRAVKILLLIVTFIGLCTDCFAYDNVVYIWQRNWNRHVEEAIASVGSSVRNFTILCGDLKFEKDRPVITPVKIKWDYVCRAGSSVTLAFRINAKAGKFFSTTAVNTLADSVTSALSKTMEIGPPGGCSIAGIQIDYDCPTSKLSDYVNFIKLIKERFKNLEISITALPTWLDSADFSELAASCDYYVLQVHSFKIPSSLDNALKPFSPEIVSSWVDKASDIGRTFYVSLPTYGYEVSFDKDGRFLGLRAETEPIRYKSGTKHAVVMTDPWKILSFLNEIEKKNPGHLLGFCWFRLPVVSDEFNWSIDTLKMVMERKVPQVSIGTEIDSPSPGLYEIYIINSGQVNLQKDVDFTVEWDKDIPVIYDLMSGYRGDPVSSGSGVRLAGIPPRVGNRKLAAWFRAGRIDTNPLKVGAVGGYE